MDLWALRVSPFPNVLESDFGISPDRGFPKLTLITEPGPKPGLILVLF